MLVETREENIPRAFFFFYAAQFMIKCDEHLNTYSIVHYAYDLTYS